jgi:hypothetical protein
MGFFTSSSKFFMYLLTSIFMLLGLAVLAAGLYMRFDSTQWDTMQSIHNGRLSVYIYMILGAAIFLLSIIGQYGAGKARRRFSLFIFQLGTLACLAVSIWGALVLFQVVNDSTTACIGDNCRNGADVNQELSNNLTQQQLDTIHKYQRPFAIFLACVAGAEGLLLICSFILCFRKSDEGLPSHYRQQNSPQGGHVTQVVVGTNGRTQPVAGAQPICYA